MKKLILDIKTWRCGGQYTSEENGTGQGYTELLNTLGYRCCLGQFLPQIDKSIKKKNLLESLTPSDLIYSEQNALIILRGYEEERPKCATNSKLTEEAMNINDNMITTIEQKIYKLKELFAEYNYEIKIK